MKLITGSVTFALALVATITSVQVAWSEEGLTGPIRTTFVEAAARSCLRTQIDGPANAGIPVSAIFEYCKCYATGMADKISNEEVKALEAIGSEKKYAEAMHSRTEAASKVCQEATRKSLLRSN
jgi:hypothetical protein